MTTCRCILNTIEIDGRCHICKLPKLMKTIQVVQPKEGECEKLSESPS